MPISRREAGRLALVATLLGTAPEAARAAPTTGWSDARVTGVQAYLYLYPLVTMDITRRQLTNVRQAETFSAPMNVFANVPTYPSADDKAVVRPNFDTLYSSAWLDLTNGPVVVSAPDTHGRYYMLPMLDMWTDVFASPGWRTTGTKAQNWAVVPPGWRGSLPAGVGRIDAPTPYVWVIGRTKTDGPADYAAVHKIQAGYRITPLSDWGGTMAPVVGRVDPDVDMKTPPKAQVESMDAARFFACAAEVLKRQKPHLTDEPIIAQMRRVGFEHGRSFDLGKQDKAVRAALETAPRDALRLMEWALPKMGLVVNHWAINLSTVGVYGNDYLKRALIAQNGLGANLPADAIYPLNLGDQDGRPLDGAHRYVLHFNKGETPPAQAFWSVTLYGSDGFQVGNRLDRFALSSWMPLAANADGSLDLYFQADDPGAGKRANWLPAPRGPFNLTMRIYAPKLDVRIGRWEPPPVRRL